MRQVQAGTVELILLMVSVLERQINYNLANCMDVITVGDHPDCICHQRGNFISPQNNYTHLVLESVIHLVYYSMLEREIDCI